MPWCWPWWLACTGPSIDAPPPAPGGVLLVTVEGVAPDDPRLAPLSAGGARWSRAYLPTPQLMPNLGTLFTGLSPGQHGVQSEGHHRLSPSFDTVFEQAQQAGFATTAATGTVRTRTGWGLHQGVGQVVEHRDQGAGGLPGDALARAVAPQRRPELSWLHLPADDLVVVPGLMSAFVEVHPQGTVIVVGVEAQGDGLSLDDANLRVPLLVQGPDHEPGREHPAVVGLPEVHAEILASLGLPTRHTLPLRQGGGQAVEHDSHAGQQVLGGRHLRGLTAPEGRVVLGAPHPRWFPARAGAIGTDAQPATQDMAKEVAMRNTLPVGHSERVFGEPADWLVLARETPWALGDPDAPAGERDPSQLVAATKALREGMRGVTTRQARLVDEQLQEPGLQGTPAATWLRAMSARQQGRFDEAAAALDQGFQHSSGPLFALMRAYLELDRRQPEAALDWARRGVEHADEAPDALASALAVSALATLPLGPLPVPERPPEVRAWSATLAAEAHPRYSIVHALLDPAHPDAVAETAAALADAPTRVEVRLAHALALWHVGETNVAVSALREVVRDEPTHTVARLLLASWDLELGRPDEAVRLLGVVSRGNPDDEALEAWFHEARKAYTPEERHERQVDRAFQRP